MTGKRVVTACVPAVTNMTGKLQRPERRGILKKDGNIARSIRYTYARTAHIYHCDTVVACALEFARRFIFKVVVMASGHPDCK